MKNCNINELDGNQKSEGEDKNEVNSNKVNSEQKDSFRQFLAKQNAEDEKRQKRKRILINTIKYLSLNNVSVTDYLSKNIFPKKPYELRGSEEFFFGLIFFTKLICFLNSSLCSSTNFHINKTPSCDKEKILFISLLKIAVIIFFLCPVKV